MGQSISGVSPNSGDRGTWQLPITISGTGTNFSNATSTVVKISQATSSLMELAVNISSVSATSVSCEVHIPNNAPLGNYTVSVYDQTAGGMVNLPNGFTVNPNSTPPTLVKTTPNKVALNQVLPITITVDNANFSQATNNTMYLSQQGTSTLLYPVPGSIVALNNTHLRASFDFSSAPLAVGNLLHSHCGNSFDGNFTDYFSIEVTAPTSLSGVINYAGTFNGVVELYQENPGANPSTPNTYSLVASSAVVLNNYVFNDVAEASYYLRAVPINMTDVVATYFAADVTWQTATLVTTNPSISSICNISPVASLSLPAGVTVNGTLGYGPNGFNKAQIVLAEGVEVFLKDVTNTQFAQSVTDQNGEYSFSGVPAGNYKIVIDLPGYNQVSTYNFALTGSSTNMSGLDFVIDNGEIFTSNFLGLDAVEINDLLVYPNPTNGELNVQLPSNVTHATMTIFNTMGQVVLEKNAVTNSQKLLNTNISELSEGIYIVRIQGDDFNAEKKLRKTK